MKLSVVVPVYNVERYVRRCILSIINQEDALFKDIELIIVNDGTKDKSIEQIQDLIDQYDNISLINQENQGLSMARNNGMVEAKSDYVWFIDSDDWIAKDAVKTLMPYLNGVNDLVSFGMIESSENGEVITCVNTRQVRTMSGIDSFRKNCSHCTAAPKAVYRKGFLVSNNLRFAPGIYNEDDEFCLRVSYLANTVTILPEALYYYYLTVAQNDAHVSITNTINPKLGFDFLVVSKKLADFAEEKIREKDVYKLFYGHIAVLINMGLRAISQCPEDAQRKFIQMYKDLGLKKCYYKAGGKYRVEGVLYSFLPIMMVKIYKLLKSTNSSN